MSEEEYKLTGQLRRVYTVDDASFLVVYTQDNTHDVRFIIRRVPCIWKDGTPLYFDDNGGVYENEAYVTAKGGVKWDGCSNVEYVPGKGYEHYCSRSELTSLGIVLGYVFDQCAEIMGSVMLDGDIGQKPPVRGRIP